MESDDMKITMIAAVARNGIIGINGAIPWYIPSDFVHFRKTTMGKPMVMGRRQFESVGRPLPGRTNIVVSRQQDYRPRGVVVMNEFGAALDHARDVARTDGADQIMIIGGGEIYQAGMEMADRLVISHVEMDVKPGPGDRVVRFPDIARSAWECEADLPVSSDERDQATYTIKVYRRRDA